MLSKLLFTTWFLMPALTWLANLALGRKLNWLLLFFATAIMGYFVLLMSVWTLDAELKAAMNRFDTDGDGGFSGAELTPEAEKAIEEWASDTGRTFAPIFGIPMTGIWYTFLLTVLYVAEWIARKTIFPNKSAETNLSFENLTARQRPDDGNPYQPPSL